jgi:putative heme-binding domain-containing protein
MKFRFLSSLSVLMFVACLGFTQEQVLFNGRDLSGWDGNPELWSVQNGYITGITKDEAPLPFNQFLIWRGGTVKNFELKVVARQAGNNSGFQYRSKELPEVGKWSIGGYQCDMHPLPVNNAMLYDERGRGIVCKNGETVIVDNQGQKFLVKEQAPVEVVVADWNEYKIIARGNHLIHQVNGKVTADIVDHQASERELEGLLAFQVHKGPAMKVEIKEVVLKVLPDGDLLSEAQCPIPAGAKLIVPTGKGKAPAKEKGAAKSKEPSDKEKAAPAKEKAPTPRKKDDPEKSTAAVEKNKPKRERPTEVGPAVNQNKATPIDRITVMKDFKVELLYSVPGGDQGSWVNLALDHKGRILASDQYGGLYRFNAPALGQSLDPSKVEKMPVDIRAANGMVWAFGALYVGINDYEKKVPCGLYKVTDTNGDDELDKVELLREIDASGDHGIHAVIPTPDGKALYLVTGNGAKMTESVKSSQVPMIWGEDHLLPRMQDGRGFMRTVWAPGGIIYRVTPDGKDFQVFSNGYRNIFDASLNYEGELFTYDADMEYDFNTSWYRPTRVNHVTSGSEYGWRNGAGKRPEFYADNLPATINIGPGSPTGTTFGYGAKFPAKYQNALYILDWSWGKLYAIHLTPDGASYKATKEDFISGLPLPLTDAIINPADGAMYFAIGGRRVQSGLYRVTYTGKESTAPVVNKIEFSPARALRQKLEVFHGKQDTQAVAVAWPSLGDKDRYVRWAARTAIEHQPLNTWLDKVMAESNPEAQIEAVMAAARVGGVCPTHRDDSTPPVDTSLAAKLLAAMEKIDWIKLSAERKTAYVRTLEIIFNRFGKPDAESTKRFATKLDAGFPSKAFDLNWLLCETLVYLESPTIAEKGMTLIANAPSQEEQIEYARSLRMLKTGWTKETRTAYFEWLLKAANYRGGASFEKFIEFVRTDALNTLSETEKVELKETLDRKPEKKSVVENMGAVFAGRKENGFTLEQVVALANEGLSKNGSLADGLTSRNLDNGRKMFGAAACFSCHRFGNEGGMNGPDLTSAGRRYSVKDLVEQIVLPSKEINEQFVPIEVVTEDDEHFRGIVVNLNGDSITLNTNAADPNERKSIDRKEIVSIEPSKVSPMPMDLLSMMTKDEILDLLAYVLTTPGS